MTKQLKTIEILNPSKSATCSMWRYPESAKIFQYRGMDFDGFRVVRVKTNIRFSVNANSFSDKSIPNGTPSPRVKKSDWGYDNAIYFHTILFMIILKEIVFKVNWDLATVQQYN